MKYERLGRPLSPKRIDVLRSTGIHERAIFHESLMVGMSAIETYRSGLYEPHDEGLDAVLVPCGFHDGMNWILDDLVAFRLDQPERWWRRIGAADVLGVVERFSMQPRRLYAQPLGWLNDLGRGLCILDWGRDPPLRVDRSIQKKLRSVAIKAATARVRSICNR